MRWFREIRPLSGLKSAEISVDGVGYYVDRSDEERARITTNMTLVQSLFTQSATRALEAPPSSPLHHVSSKAFITSVETEKDDDSGLSVRLLNKSVTLAEYNLTDSEYSCLCIGPCNPGKNGKNGKPRSVD